MGREMLRYGSIGLDGTLRGSDGPQMIPRKAQMVLQRLGWDLRKLRSCLGGLDWGLERLARGLRRLTLHLRRLTLRLRRLALGTVTSTGKIFLRSFVIKLFNKALKNDRAS